jgi:hypothetical protein
MDALFDPLQQLSSLRPGPGTTERDLDAALGSVRSALAAGQSARSLLRGAHGDVVFGRAVRRGVAAGRLVELEGTRSPFPAPKDIAVPPREIVAVRSTPIAALDPLAPDWTHGVAPHVTRGPFLNELGEQFWIDAYRLPHLVTIEARSTSFGAPRMVARVSIRRVPTAVDQLRLAAGSIWLAARELVPGRPSDEFVGLRIRRGTVRLQGVSTSTTDAITLDEQWRIVLSLELDPPQNLQPADGPGADAAHAHVDLPLRVEIVLERARSPVVQFGEAMSTAWGTDIRITRSDAAPFYDTVARAVVIPGDASTEAFAFATVRSQVWQIGGTVPIARSGWALPVTVSSAPALGEAAGAGALWVELSAATTVSWIGQPQAIASPKVVLSLAPATLIATVTLLAAQVTQELLLWDEAGVDPPRRSSVAVTSEAGSFVIHMSQAGSDAVIFGGAAAGHLDRPVAADGLRVRIRMPIAWLIFFQNAGGTNAGVVAADPEAQSAPHLAFALENAFLKVRPPAWLGVAGQFNQGAVDSGLLVLRFAHRATLPTLPDPYAANFGFDRRQDVDMGWVSAAVGWPDPQRPALSFATDLPSGSQPAPAATVSRVGAMRVLLDISSHADQFGVVLPEHAAAVQGMSLVARARDVAVMTLPPISWEPMLTKAPKPGDGDIALPPPPHDGGPATLIADVVELRPVEPIPLLTTFNDAINTRRHFAARFPLPFGLTALIRTAAEAQEEQSDFIPQGNRVFLNRPTFDPDLEGGHQLSVRGRGVLPADSMDPLLPGRAELCADNNYALGVLSTNLHTRFDGDFGSGSPQAAPGVPLRQYDWSGYGASVFSDWRFAKAVGPAIVQVQFSVLVGRTAHEVVQMQSVIYPWYIKVVRTITIDRTGGGWVLREDSGWIATSDGRFAYQDDTSGNPQVFAAFPPQRVHPGAMEALVGVRHIRLNGPQFPLPKVKSGSVPQTIWQPVRFDADVLFIQSGNPRLRVTEGSAGRQVPSRNISGWILIDGPTYDLPMGGGKTVSRVRPADAQQVADLLLINGPAIAPIECGLAFGGTASDPGLRFRGVQLTASCTDDNPRHLVAAVRGSPALPRDGQWSIARIGQTDPAPNALDPTFPVPVVRPNAPATVSNRWHLADPHDITQLADAATPATRYGLVQSLGTQKVFFPRPRVGNDPDPITVPKPPQLADVGALLNASSIFPALAEAFDFKNLKSLSVTNGQVGFTDTFEIPGGRKAVLADLGGADGIQVLIKYEDEHAPPKPTIATVTVNPAASPRWSLTLTRVGFTVMFRGAALIQIFASVRASELSAPTVHDLNVRYEGILSALQTIFTNVQQVARFLPGGKDAGIRVAFSQGHLTISNAFALPNLPLGAGQITDVTADMGFDVALAPFDVRFVAGLGTSEKPFRWIVSPLAGTGVVRVGISAKGLDVLVQAGLGLGLAIDLGIASGAASVALAFEINTGPTPFELRVILSGRASVDVLAGLASATITLACGLGVIPPDALLKPPYLPPSIPPPNPVGPFTVGITGSVSVGIHISVCWVIDVDWDGYWQFRQDIETPAIPIPLL